MNPLNIAAPYLLLAKILAVVALMGGGAYLYHRHAEGLREEGRVEVRAEWAAKDRADADLRAADAIQQRKFNDHTAGQHAAAITTLSEQLGVANEKIAHLPGRACLDPRAVSVLNATGVLSGGTPAGEPESAAPGTAATASNGTGLRVSTDRDVAGYIALIRTRYGELASQLNSILDIEDKRHPPEAPQ